MTAFAYTTKRGLVKTSFNKIGTDISVASADDSFNSVTTVLTGLLDNEWVNVSGFLTNAVNNGWFQVNGNSAANKILEDSFTPLVDEAAGDTVTLQGYYRGLGQVYNLETASHRILPTDSAIVNQASALDGTPETIFTRNDAEWSILTDFISESDWPQWREFMNSVSGGEVFTIDPFGTIAVPASPVSVRLVGRPSYTNPYSRTMQISIRAREV